MVRDLAGKLDANSRNSARRNVLKAGSLVCLGLPSHKAMGRRTPEADLDASALGPVGGLPTLTLADPNEAVRVATQSRLDNEPRR